MTENKENKVSFSFTNEYGERWTLSMMPNGLATLSGSDPLLIGDRQFLITKTSSTTLEYSRELQCMTFMGWVLTDEEAFWLRMSLAICQFILKRQPTNVAPERSGKSATR